MLLNILRRTIIPPLWGMFQQIPGGTKFWQWSVRFLRSRNRQSFLAQIKATLDPRIAVIETSPKIPVTLCKLSNLSDFNNPEWADAAHELGIAMVDVNLTKKYWEYIHLVYGLKTLHCLKPTTRILSVGCGYEIPLFYLTSHAEHILGIDLFDGVEDIQEAFRDIDQRFAFPVARDRLTLRRMDARSLEFKEASFDLVFSLSAIEHFGGNASAAMAMQEMGRVLKPGGIAAISTEVVLNNLPHPVFFSIDDLYEFVIRPSRLSLIEPLDLSIFPSLLEDPPEMDQVKQRPFLVVLCGGVVFTSVMLFLVKEK